MTEIIKQDTGNIKDKELLDKNWYYLIGTKAGRRAIETTRCLSATSVEYRKFREFVSALSTRCGEIKELIRENSGDGNYVSGLMGEKEQILKEIEEHALKTMKRIREA